MTVAPSTSIVPLFACGHKRLGGNVRIVDGDSVCRVCNRDRIPRRFIHGDAMHRDRAPVTEYRIWCGMLSRCRLRTHEAYARYGGRGITVCERWLRYENFLADMGRRPSLDYSLDRKDNDGNYEPDNCRWATRHEQAINTSTVRLVTYNGETMSIAGWSERLNMSYRTAYRRIIIEGKTPEEAFAISPREYRRAAPGATGDMTGSDVTRIREACGMTREELATYLDFKGGSRSVSRIERGKRRVMPRVDAALNRLADGNSVRWREETKANNEYRNYANVIGGE